MFFIFTAPLWFWINDGTHITSTSTQCTSYGYFILVLPIMGFLLLVCYVWGRYYANKLDYAQTVKNLLHDSDDEENDYEADTDLQSAV